MSKTVMRAMMIGLVAMLGARVEAHSYVFGGKAKYCSVCVEAELAEHDNPVTQITQIDTTHSEKVEFCVTTKKIDILCPSNTKKVSKRVRLPVVQQLVPIGTTIVQGIVSDDSLKTADFCEGELPDAVVIRAMQLKIGTYACANLDGTNCEPVSELNGECNLSNEYDFSDVGAPYDCSWDLPK